MTHRSMGGVRMASGSCCFRSPRDPAYLQSAPLCLSGWDTFPFQCVATEHYSPLGLECWPFPLQGLVKPRSWTEKQSTLHQRKAGLKLCALGPF